MTVTPALSQLPREGRLRSLADFYWTAMRTEMQAQFQYRAATYMYLLGMVAEPVIYLVVWSTIADQSGGAVGGFDCRPVRGLLHRLDAGADDEHRLHAVRLGVADPRGDAVWTALAAASPDPLRRRPVRGREDPLASLLPPDRGRPDARVQPDVRHTTCRGGGVRCRHLGCVPDRTFNQSALGLVTFWTTRVGALFSLYIVLELLLSGRLVPLTLMPHWVQTVAWFLPFRWTFYFPIQSLVGDLSNAELAAGLGMQLLWTLIGIGVFSLVWRHAIRRYTAVGN